MMRCKYCKAEVYLGNANGYWSKNEWLGENSFCSKAPHGYGRSGREGKWHSPDEVDVVEVIIRAYGEDL